MVIGATNSRNGIRAARTRLAELMRSARELGQQWESLSRRLVAVERRVRRWLARTENERARRAHERSQTARAELERADTLLAQLDADRLAAGARLARPSTQVVRELFPRIERMEDETERLQARMLAIAALLDDGSTESGRLRRGAQRHTRATRTTKPSTKERP